ncbi:MAG TPA: aspartyl protease family protein [Dehalococcoidia bacterium]|nr:aspartyl protease family protein [Dehalococcoidia bacterium]
MGTFRFEITLLPVNGGSPETLDALVDTGSTFTSVPGTLLERLGVKPHRTIQMRLADGSARQRPMGRLMAEIKGEREEILCVFGEAGDLPTIGAHTLEAFLLAVDPVKQDLIPSEALWALSVYHVIS